MRLAPGALWYAVPPLALAPIAGFVWLPAGALFLAIGLFVLAFFRDPVRTPPERGVLAPADGKISVLREEDGRVRVGTFMNVWNVHVVRAPVGGRVVDREHVPGAHRPAFSKDSDRNERLHLDLDPAGDVPAGDGSDDSGNGPRLTLIAGAFARRITPYVSTGDRLERGQRVGHIAFGSRVDVLFPPAVSMDEVTVRPGDRVRAGRTVLLEHEDEPRDRSEPIEETRVEAAGIDVGEAESDADGPTLPGPRKSTADGGTGDTEPGHSAPANRGESAWS